MSPGARAVWGLHGFQNDQGRALCLALGRGRVTKFFLESQCHSALCLNSKRRVVEKLKECISLIHLTGVSSVDHRNKRNFRSSWRKQRRLWDWAKAEVFSLTQGPGSYPHSVVSQIYMTKHKMTWVTGIDLFLK